MKLYKVYFTKDATLIVAAKNIEAAMITAKSHYRLAGIGYTEIHSIRPIEEEYTIVVDTTVVD